MELIYKKAGAIELIRYENGVDGDRCLVPGVISSISTPRTLKTSTLPDGNSMYDMEFDTGADHKITVNLSSFVPQIYATLNAATVTKETTTNNTLRKIKRYTIPSATPYTVTLADTPSGDPVVHYADDDEPLTKATSEPKKGEYSHAAGVLTFNVADAGEVVVVACDVTKTSLNRMALPNEPKSATFRMIIAGEAVLKDDHGAIVEDTMIFDIVKPSGEITPPSREKEPKGWSFTMTVQPPRGSNPPVDYRWILKASS